MKFFYSILFISLVSCVTESSPSSIIEKNKMIDIMAEVLVLETYYHSLPGNPASNKQAHIETTAEEIWEQTSGKVDGFICSVGSGGTLAGVSEGLKRKNSNIKIGLSDPYGSSLYSYIKTNALAAEGSSITEGIGTSRITKNFENTKVDFAYRIDDTNALNTIFGLLKNEGLCLGTSSGINVAGAIEMAKEMGPGKTIVTILCDVGSRSASKIFNVDFLKSKNLPYPDWL